MSEEKPNTEEKKATTQKASKSSARSAPKKPTASVLNYIQTNLKAPKNQYNSYGGFHYRSCEDVLNALKPFLAETGTELIINDDIAEAANGRVYIKATARLCKDGEVLAQSEAFAREQESKKGMDESQVTGATSSYARKYALNGLFLIDDSKDADALPKDGDKKTDASKKASGAGQRGESKPPKEPPETPKEPPKKPTEADWVQKHADDKWHGILWPWPKHASLKGRTLGDIAMDGEPDILQKAWRYFNGKSKIDGDQYSKIADAFSVALAEAKQAKEANEAGAHTEDWGEGPSEASPLKEDSDPLDEDVPF